MGSLTTEHGKACYRADFIAYGIALASGATSVSAQRYAERVEAWEDEGGALLGGAAVRGRTARVVSIESAR
jgi:hypothetical protein